MRDGGTCEGLATIAVTKIWLTRNAQLPLREQLVRQVALAILSGELKPGAKLPAVRTIARQHEVHPNTVSAAFHELVERGWLEMRRGSGLYVQKTAAGSEEDELDAALLELIEKVRRSGRPPEDALRRLNEMLNPPRYRRVVVIEPDAGMRALLEAELGSIFAAEFIRPDELNGRGPDPEVIYAALPTRAAAATTLLPEGARCVTLRIASAGAALRQAETPTGKVLVAIVSGAREFREWARILLIAAGLDSEAVYEIDTSEAGWKRRVKRADIVVADALSGSQIPDRSDVRVFRVVAGEMLDELCKLTVTPQRVS